MNKNDVGIFADIPNAAYHGGDGVSKSGLDLIARSPMHYRHARDAANDNDPTNAQRIGSAAHKLILEPDTFDTEFAVAPDVDRRTKEGKELWTAFAADSAGKTLLTESEMDQLEAMRDAVMAHPAARGLLSSVPGRAELSAYWRDTATGVLCRCRPDWWRADGILVDLKTTDDASPEEFGRSVLKWRYHVQAAMYLDGTRRAAEQGGGLELIVDPAKGEGIPAFPNHFLFVVVEKKPPHAVAVYKLDSLSLQHGAAEYRRDLARYVDCLERDSWPAFGETVLQTGLPEWFLRRELAGISA
jgi:hypothetical protein